MEQTKGFYDLCVPYNRNEKAMRVILKELVELGYKTIAIEQSFDHSKKDVGKRAADIFPEPYPIQLWHDEFNNQLKILQRLTILYVDGAVTHAMTNSLNVRKYNLIAGQPKTDAALTHCCTAFNGDIVTFDSNSGARLMVNRKGYQIAVKRGMFFEIKYSPAISDSNNRKDMIKIAHNYFVKGKSKSIVITSGATNAFELRSPYDVANMAFIFGLSEDNGKNAIDKFCRQLFLRAESRRLGKTIMYVKSSGPIVFSDSSDEEDDDEIYSEMNITKEITKVKSKVLQKRDKDKSNDDEGDNFFKQPNKKFKTS